MRLWDAQQLPNKSGNCWAINCYLVATYKFIASDLMKFSRL